MDTQKLKCFLGFHETTGFYCGGVLGKICYHCLKSIVIRDDRSNKLYKGKDGDIICPRFGSIKPEWSCYLFCNKYLGENRCAMLIG